MEELKKLVSSILEQGFLLSLATVDEGGPWVSDVIFVHDESFNLFWMSMENTRHSRAILKNKKVAGTITVSNNAGEGNVGLQIQGIAEKIEGDILEIARKHRKKRNKPEPEREGEILAEGESWYCLKPKKIEIIYEPYWGFEKRGLEL